MPLLRITEYNWSPGQSVQLFTGHVVETDDDGEVTEEHPDRKTTIGVDHHPAEQLADLVNAGESGEQDFPLASFEHWQVLA